MRAFVVLLFVPFFLHGATPFQELLPAKLESALQLALDEDRYGEAEQLIKEKIDSLSPADRSPWQLFLASVYLKDQKEEEAFRMFVEALGSIQEPREALVDMEESEEYRSALALYLSESTQPPEVVAEVLEKKVLPLVQSNPQSALLRFLLAVSYANRRWYDQFFYHFYMAYKQLPTSFLAYRTQAILHIKLLEKARRIEEKELYRRHIQRYLRLALGCSEQDSSLYKLQIVFAPTQEKGAIVREVLHAILDDGSAVIPRKEIAFYVREAVAHKEHGLAKQFLDKATGWYQYSRVVEELRKVVDDDKSCTHKSSCG